MITITIMGIIVNMEEINCKSTKNNKDEVVFACDVGIYCEAGMIITFAVSDAVAISS